jgi:hypothetical protein
MREGGFKTVIGMRALSWILMYEVAGVAYWLHVGRLFWSRDKVFPALVTIPRPKSMVFTARLEMFF